MKIFSWVVMLSWMVLLLPIQGLAKDGAIRLLTSQQLLADGFRRMSAEEINQQLLSRVLVVTDLQAESEYEIQLLQGGATKRKKIKGEAAKTLTDIDYQARPALLTEDASFTINGNQIISTDGVRTYNISLYIKAGEIYGVRDIDNGKVNFQIKLK